MTVEDLETLFDYGYWANAALRDVLSRVTTEQFTQPVVWQLRLDPQHDGSPVERRVGLARALRRASAARAQCAGLSTVTALF
jgi:hypothetical protein